MPSITRQEAARREHWSRVFAAVVSTRGSHFSNINGEFMQDGPTKAADEALKLFDKRFPTV